MGFGDGRRVPAGAAEVHFAKRRSDAPTLVKPLEERWCDAFEAACAAAKRQHALNRKLYPRAGSPAVWSQPAPPEASFFEASISLLCFLEGLIESYVRVRHGQVEALRWVHAVFATAASKVQAAAESHTPNTSGFTDVPHEIVAAGEALADLFATAPLDPFRSIDSTPSLTVEPARLRPSTWKLLIETYDMIGLAAFGTNAEWEARGRTGELTVAWERGHSPSP